LWPFTFSISKGEEDEGNRKHGHHHGPPADFGGPYHSRPPGVHYQSHQEIQQKHGHHNQGGHGHHGWGHGIEYEKMKLKYDIYKLKAKKKIAVLQNKIELKKILSLLLHHKIKALEWLA